MKMPLKDCFSCLRFPKEPVITELDLSSTVVTDIFTEVWQHERTLEKLVLTSTRIKTLPPQLFYCQSLRVLVLNNNSLDVLPNAIGSLSHLQHLNISHNFISNLPPELKSCKNLQHLDLSCNSLQRVPDVIPSIISLQELFLNETYMEFLPANFGRLINLRILELRLNNLISIPKSILRLSNLQRLDIGGNEFTELPEIIGELKHLQELWIDFNQIRRIHPNVGKLKELRHFEANGNLLDSLPNELSLWCNIEVLSICTNLLKSLPFNLGLMKSLVSFKCESNELSSLPDSISNLENLEELVVSHNKLTSLPTTIGLLRKLRFLFADGNELSALPDELCSCNNLSILSVSRNRIRELPHNIGHLANLKVLNVVGNAIATLPVSVLSLVNLTSFWINDNQSQPLVPLQYINPNTKTHLTCFMLPQTTRIEETLSPTTTTSQQNHVKTPMQYSDSTLPYEEQPSAVVYASKSACYENPSRRICFAEEATILTSASATTSTTQPHRIPYGSEQQQQQQQLHHQQYQEISPTSVPTTIGPSDLDNDNDLSVRLLRSPTPYPKELRLMAKYVRNSQKIAPEASELPVSNQFNVKEARVVMKPNALWNNYEEGNVSAQSYVRNHLEDSSSLRELEISKQQQQQQQQLQQQDDQMSVLTVLSTNIPQANGLQYNVQIANGIEQYHPIYLNSNTLYENSLDGNSYCLRSDVDSQDVVFHVDESTVSNNNKFLPEPPPYHIARAFTKKSEEDFSNYNAMRMERTLAPAEMTTSELRLDQSTAITNANDTQRSYTPNITANYQYEAITRTSTATDQTDAVCEGTPQTDGQRSLEGSIRRSTEGSGGGGGKTRWMFGVHKNPTVKQISLKWDNDVGFSLKNMPNEEGLFVSSTVPNTNASKLLQVNDKLLEIDGYDLLSSNLNEANRLLANAGSTLNIMLSRR